MHPIVVAVLAFLAGSVPCSQVAARCAAGVDLRDVGSGTVSGSGLFRVAGFGPLAIAGVFELAKGTVGPLLAGADRPVLRALTCGLAVAGHNWSPFLRGAGGRGISPAMGALAITAWPGTVVLAAGLAAGKLLERAGLAMFVAIVALTPVLAVTHGAVGALAGAAVTVPMLLKRLLGNAAPTGPGAAVYRHRLLYDNDEVPAG